MPATHARFGTDLRLLPDLEPVKSSRDPGHDLAVRQRPETRQVDLDTWSNVDNLAQALFLRFLTPLGELAILGHAEYGSKLHTLLGELNTETNRNRAKLYVLQALHAEPRVKEVISVKATRNPKKREQMDIEVKLRTIDSDTTLNLVFPFFLEGGVSP